jgi:hypothetical protein
MQKAASTKRGLFKSIIFVALVAAVSIAHITFMRDSQAVHKKQRHPRLPSHHRLATTCRPSSSNFAAKSNEPRVPIETQKKFVNKGYELIAKGSGIVNAVGPVINKIARVQHKNGIYGTLAEMGVHHGRFTGFIFITSRQTEKLIVADLFSHQEKNVDLSGLGDRKMFMRGLQTYGLSEKDLHSVFEGSTDELPFDWSEQGGFEPFRMISVDAGHTAALTFNDLELSFCNALKGAVVILDDWYVYDMLSCVGDIVTVVVALVECFISVCFFAFELYT